MKRSHIILLVLLFIITTAMISSFNKNISSNKKNIFFRDFYEVKTNGYYFFSEQIKPKIFDGQDEKGHLKLDTLDMQYNQIFFYLDNSVFIHTINTNQKKITAKLNDPNMFRRINRETGQWGYYKIVGKQIQIVDFLRGDPGVFHHWIPEKLVFNILNNDDIELEQAICSNCRFGDYQQHDTLWFNPNKKYQFVSFKIKPDSSLAQDLKIKACKIFDKY